MCSHKTTLTTEGLSGKDAIFYSGVQEMCPVSTTALIIFHINRKDLPHFSDYAAHSQMCLDLRTVLLVPKKE